MLNTKKIWSANGNAEIAIFMLDTQHSYKSFRFRCKLGRLSPRNIFFTIDRSLRLKQYYKIHTRPKKVPGLANIFIVCDIVINRLLGPTLATFMQEFYARDIKDARH
jgi:hypothetical protein